MVHGLEREPRAPHEQIAERARELAFDAVQHLAHDVRQLRDDTRGAARDPCRALPHLAPRAPVGVHEPARDVCVARRAVCAGDLALDGAEIAAG
jgi:hypothetical protein